jgi:hypothetical protein
VCKNGVLFDGRKSNIKLNRKTKTKKRGTYKKIQKGGNPTVSTNPLMKKNMDDINYLLRSRYYANCDRFDLNVNTIDLKSDDMDEYKKIGYKYTWKI